MPALAASNNLCRQNVSYKPKIRPHNSKKVKKLRGLTNLGLHFFRNFTEWVQQRQSLFILKSNFSLTLKKQVNYYTLSTFKGSGCSSSFTMIPSKYLKLLKDHILFNNYLLAKKVSQELPTESGDRFEQLLLCQSQLINRISPCIMDHCLVHLRRE